MKTNTPWLNHKTCDTEQEAEQFCNQLIGGGFIQLQDDGKWHAFGLRELQDRIAQGLPI